MPSQGRCVQCGAEIVYGEKPHEMEVHLEAETRIELRCRLCAEEYAWGSWPDDFGPFPFQFHQPGKC
jgi:hypothetical protein